MMQLVINIPVDEYNAICNGTFDTDGYFKMNLSDAFTNGTPLPKGHGRLIDADAIVYEKECVYLSDGGCTTESTPNISATPTIIEADQESK